MESITRSTYHIKEGLRMIFFKLNQFTTRIPITQGFHFLYVRKTGGFPPIRDFLLKIRSRLGDRILRFFGNFWQKPQKRAKKPALSSSSSALDGFRDGERAEGRGPAARFRPAARRHPRVEGRGPAAAERNRAAEGRLSSIWCPVAVS